LLTQVDNPKTWSWSVADARYFRTQADLYLELSRRMSLQGDAEYFRVLAARHLAMALELEGDAVHSPSRPAAPETKA
jgi:hypothetical protein